MTSEIHGNTDTFANNDLHPVIKCDSVYKIFGDNIEKLVRNSGGNIDVDSFQDAGCIFGVNNASFEVRKG